MKLGVWRWCVMAAACLTGIVAGQWLLRSVGCRDAIGVLFGRGHLLALAQGRGIYERDLDRAFAEKNEAAGERQDQHREQERDATIRWLVANAMARVYARQETIAPDAIDREMEVLRSEFGDAKVWRSALRKSGLTPGSLRSTLGDDLRADQWIRRRMDSLQATPDECRAFYEAHPESFFAPERFRVSHLFLAAPSETPADIVEQKRARIEALSKRLAAGEDLFELVALESEDEENKARGGDLGFISESRVPADVFAAIRQLSVGQISPPVRTHLGFHILQLTDSKPPYRFSFEEAQPEIALHIRNQKQQAAVSNLVPELARGAQFVEASRPGPPQNQ